MSNYAPRKGMSEADIEQAVTSILAEASLDEKVAMMSGRGFFEQFQKGGGIWGGDPYRAGGGCDRLGVPALYFTDGPRGVSRGNSTCFPCTMARGASFDADMERRIGEVMGIEARAQDCNLSGAVCVNLLRHPAWGRAQETYGEDPCHLGEMGAALATGIQTHNVIATAKHFALNSIENARFQIDVRVAPRPLHEIYLFHFKKILDAGCASVMSAYNKVNGEYCGQNRVLLTEILRQQWGFGGFVHSDWVMGVHQPYGAVAGLDVENPEPIKFGQKLIDAVEKGTVEPAAIDTACRRILTTLYRFASAEDPLEEYTSDLVAAPSHRALAEEAALKSAVLLKNAGLLPLKRDKIGRLAVFGRLAKLENTGDYGSSRVRPPYVVTPYQGLEAYLGADKVVFGGDETDLDSVNDAAGDADAAVVVVGYTADEEGEYIPGDIALGEVDLTEAAQTAAAAGHSNSARGGDRDDLRLPRAQVALIDAVAAANPNVIVVAVAGSAVIATEWLGNAKAVLQTFYAGMEGGTALAKLCFGEVSPSGKLPFTVPESEDELPFFDKNATSIEYGPYHGYTLFDKEGRQPAFAFGFGLSYASFAYRALKARRQGDCIVAQASVRNTGTVPATEVAQLYVGFPGRTVDRPDKLLRGFARVGLRPGETKTVSFRVPLDDLKWWNPETAAWTLEAGTHHVLVGGSSRSEDLLSHPVAL